MYYKRIIDKYLSEWASRDTRKPILLRGARQVGKSSAVRHLGKQLSGSSSPLLNYRHLA